MANDISGAVWRIDTLPFEYNAPVKIVTFSWTEATSSTGRFTATTIAGKPIIDVSNPPIINSGYMGWVPSFKLVTLDGGIVLISVGAGR